MYPVLIDEIRAKSQDCQCRLEKLGEPRMSIDEQRSYLLQISQSFQSLLRAAVDGTYNEPFFEDVRSVDGYPKRLRAVVQNLSEVVAEEITEYGAYRRLCSSHDGAFAPEGQLLVTRDEYISHIKSLLKKTRGRELSGTFNLMIVRDLFLEQCSPWEGLTTRHTTTVWEAAREFLRLAVGYVADEATAKALLEEIIVPALEDLRQTLQQKELLLPHQRGHPITYNHYFTETLQKIRAQRREHGLRGILEDFFNMDDLEGPYYSGSNIYPNQLLKNLLESSERDMDCFSSSEALDCLLSYYKVALKRFVDDIANEVIEAKLVSALPVILSPVTVFNMPAEKVTRIAGESEENQALREQLNKKLQILRAGYETCKRFVGIRAFEIRKDSRFYGQDDHEGSSEGSSKILEEFSGPVAAGPITAGSTPSSPADGFDGCHFTLEQHQVAKYNLRKQRKR
ncbi:hypothetical protein BDV18DRAFT_164702 [Aspergillus unguis]